MTNPLKGEATLSLADGRSFTLAFDMEALIEAESAYGKPLKQLMQDASAGFVGAVRSLIYGGLRARHPEITLREASTILMENSDALSIALEAALAASMPDPKKGAEDKEGGNPRGKASGSSGAKQS